MKKEKFTHLVKVFGIPTYYNEETKSFKGKNLLFDLTIDTILWWGILLEFEDKPIEFKIIRKLDINEEYQ